MAGGLHAYHHQGLAAWVCNRCSVHCTEGTYACLPGHTKRPDDICSGLELCCLLPRPWLVSTCHRVDWLTHGRVDTVRRENAPHPGQPAVLPDGPGWQLAAPAAPRAIDLPAQPLAQALNALAQQAGRRLLVAPDLVAGKMAPAVQGSLTVDEALRQVLTGSGLEAVVQGETLAVRQSLAL